MKEKIDNLVKLIALWTVGVLGGGIIFPFLRAFGGFRIVGHEKRKSISKEGLIVICKCPFLFLCEPVIFPFLFPLFYVLFPAFVANIKNYNGKFWFLLLIERNNKKGWESIRHLIQRVKESKIIILAPDKGEEFKTFENGVNEESPKIRRFQGGISILLKETQTTTIPILIEKEEKAIPNQSFVNDRLFFLSIWGRIGGE